jgi:hypothetical protein
MGFINSWLHHNISGGAVTMVLASHGASTVVLGSAEFSFWYILGY